MIGLRDQKKRHPEPFRSGVQIQKGRSDGGSGLFLASALEEDGKIVAHRPQTCDLAAILLDRAVDLQAGSHEIAGQRRMSVLQRLRKLPNLLA